ncbi:hypothetical protein [Aurantimonas sp. NFXS3]|uniref:DUF4376 domain-containing protein n=1 Tax=Aurantimonas sp. NFXS3 TaxID=2818434 RepID=UPI003B8AAEA3
MKKALVVDDVISEFPKPPEGFTLQESLHPDVFAALIEVPLIAEAGWVLRGGAVLAPSGPGLKALKDSASSAVNAKRDATIASGYRHNFGGSAGSRTLDQRTELDAINWLGLKGIADSAIAAGHGSAPIAIRDANDDTFDASANVVSSAMVAMGQWRGAVMARAWALKDAIREAADETDLEAIDIDAGWPG